jgi:hypothetical protein
MVYVGINIYFWGESEQRRLLLTGLQPWARASRASGLAEGFWYCQFDARGPHIFALFTTKSENREALVEYLRDQVRAFLLRAPSTETPDLGVLLRRHSECRGKILCAPDRGDDIAPNNSFALFDHEVDGYPLWMSSGMESAAEFWQLQDRLTFWVLANLENGTQRVAAIGWLAAVGRVLGTLTVPAEEYWQNHALTLIPALADRLKEQHHATEMLPWLTAALGETNIHNLRVAWAAQVRLGFDVERLVRLILADDGRSIDQRLHVLREINHITLIQLDQPVRLHIPLVLYAWKRELLQLRSSVQIPV